MFLFIFRQRLACWSDGLDKVWRNVIALVGNCSGKVCHLQWHHQVLALTNGNGVDIGQLPWPTSICSVIERRCRNEPAFFVWQINTEAFSESKAFNVFAPFF